jgi:hypothetical protein
MFIVDHPSLLKPQQYQRLRVELDRIITNEKELTAFVEERIAGKVKRLTVIEIDFVRETMRLDVRADT